MAGAPLALPAEAVEEGEGGQRLEDAGPHGVEVDRAGHHGDVGLVGRQLRRGHLADVEALGRVLVGRRQALEHADVLAADERGPVATRGWGGRPAPRRRRPGQDRLRGSAASSGGYRSVAGGWPTSAGRRGRRGHDRAMAVVLALITALSYGVGDFTGGLAARRAAPLTRHRHRAHASAWSASRVLAALVGAERGTRRRPGPRRGRRRVRLPRRRPALPRSGRRADGGRVADLGRDRGGRARGRRAASPASGRGRRRCWRHRRRAGGHRARQPQRSDGPAGPRVAPGGASAPGSASATYFLLISGRPRGGGLLAAGGRPGWCRVIARRIAGDGRGLPGRRPARRARA